MDNTITMVIASLIVAVLVFLVVLYSRKISDRDWKIGMLKEVINSKIRASNYLREKITSLKQQLELKNNRLKYLERELRTHDKAYSRKVEDLEAAIDRIRMLEAAIANPSIKPLSKMYSETGNPYFSNRHQDDKPIKPLNTALDEMNKTADKYTPKRGEYILAVDPFQSEAEKLPNIHEVLKRYDAMKGIHNSYEHQIADKLSFGSRASEAYASYFGGNHESPKDIKLNVDSDEDQYNTVNEEQEVNSECDCVNCKAMRNEAKYYQDWRKKQKSGYRKETDYDS